MSNLTLTNPLVQTYIVYSSILGIKILLMSFLTAFTRMTKGVFANPEDAKLRKGGKVKYDDPQVERIRRAHLNDLESIPVFWVVAALYITTGPVVAWATLLFRVYAISRIVHTVVYAVIPMPQPSRAIAFMIPHFISLYLGAQVALHYITAL